MMSDFIYHEPKRKLVQNLDSCKVKSEIGDAASMCPNCFHMVETYMNYITILNHITDQVEDFRTDNNYYGVCPNCHKDVKFELMDANMAKIINILNNKGYYTAFCCEGHIEPDDYTGEEIFSSPYIYFYSSYDLNILSTNPLPDTWDIDNDDARCKIFVIRDNIHKEIPPSIFNSDNNEIIDSEAYIKWLKENWDQKKRLEDIYNWAVNLPNKRDTVKKYEREFINLQGTNILFKNAEKICDLLAE